MARSLATSGINSILIPDSAIYAVMSRVNKVILGAHAILANGGVFAATGSVLVALAAQTHRTPVVFCAGQFKLSPLWNVYHAHGSLDFANPAHVLGFEEAKLMNNVDVLNPTYDYVPPEVINVFITNEYVILSIWHLYRTHRPFQWRNSAYIYESVRISLSPDL